MGSAVSLCPIGAPTKYSSWTGRSPRSGESSVANCVSTMNRGFVTIWMLHLFILFVILFWSLKTLCLWQEKWIEMSAACREVLLQSQEIAARGIQELLQLNPMVQKLRAQVSLAKMQLAAAVATQNAPLAATAQGRLRVLRLELHRISQQQRQIQQQTLAVMQESLSRGGSRILQMRQVSSVHFDRARLALRAVRDADGGTIFEFQTPFSERQAVHGTCIWRGKSMKEANWVQQKWNRRMRFAATLTGPDLSFRLHARLIADKF